MSIRSKTLKRGDPNESSWPSEFGTGARKFKRKQRQLEPTVYVIDDTMPDTKSPLSRNQYFSSKRALRKHYKQHGYEEVGTDYENGSVDRMTQSYEREQEQRVSQNIRQNLIDRVIHGKR